MVIYSERLAIPQEQTFEIDLNTGAIGRELVEQRLGKVGIVRGYQGKMNGEEMFRVEFKDGRVRTFLASELELWFRIGVK